MFTTKSIIDYSSYTQLEEMKIDIYQWRFSLLFINKEHLLGGSNWWTELWIKSQVSDRIDKDFFLCYQLLKGHSYVCLALNNIFST